MKQEDLKNLAVQIREERITEIPYQGSIHFRNKKALVCWILDWRGKKTLNGYPAVWISADGSFEYVHRIFFSTFKQKPIKNRIIKNLCNVKGCVNPWHHIARNKRTTGRHGLSISNPTFYNVYRNIKRYHDNPAKSVKRFGCEIKLCPEWYESIEVCFSVVGEPSESGFYLYPSDKTKPFSKDNFYWEKLESDLSPEEIQLVGHILGRTLQEIEKFKLTKSEANFVYRIRCYYQKGVVQKKDFTRLVKINEKYTSSTPAQPTSKHERKKKSEPDSQRYRAEMARLLTEREKLERTATTEEERQQIIEEYSPKFKELSVECGFRE